MPRPMATARRAAQQHGRRFYAGLACRYGHEGERYTSTNACRECVRQQARPDRQRVTQAAGDPLADVLG